MFVGRPPTIAWAFWWRVKFVPDQVVPHRPAKFIGGNCDAVRYEKQSLLPVCVANYEKARTSVCRDTEQLLQNASNVVSVFADCSFPSQLTIDAVVSMAKIRRRRNNQVRDAIRQGGENLLGVAADNAVYLHCVILFAVHFGLDFKKAIILRRSRSSRAGSIRHSQMTITCQPDRRNAR